MSKTILTKSVFMHVPTPVAYSVLSCLVTAFCMLPLFLCKPNLWASPTPAMMLGFLGVCIAIAMELACTNVAISLLSVALQQCIRAASPAATVILESFWTGRCRHPLLYAVVLLLCTGPILAQMGSSSYDYTPFGVVMMSIAVVSGAFKYVLAHAMIHSYKKSLGTIAFTFWVEIFVGLMLTPWAVLNGEAYKLATGPYTRADWALLLFTAAYGGVRIYSQFALLEYASATTLSLTNVAIQAGTIAMGFVFFDTELTFYLALGVGVTLFFSAIYTWIVTTKCLDSSAPGKSLV